MTDSLITLENIRLSIGGRVILHDITLPIHRGELLTIVGPNGAGKSTLLRLILGQMQADSGTITRSPKLKTAYVPQSFHTPPDLPITAGRFLKDLKDPEKPAILETLGIAHLQNSPLQHLSGGETQRLLLVRAMLTKPDLIALDEPAAGIDPAALGRYYQAIRDYQLKTGCAIILISHDLHLVMAASDRVLCLNGHICCAGRPEDVAAHPEFLSLTGGSRAIGVYTHHHEHSHDILS